MEQRATTEALSDEITPRLERAPVAAHGGQAGREAAAVPSRPALAVAGLGLAAAAVLGFIVLSSVAQDDATPISAAGEGPTPTDDWVSVGEPPTLIVDIFSGRPNPTIDLTDTGFTQLRATIDSLDVDPGAMVAPRDGLGFRGFVVERYGYGPEIYSLLVTEEAVLLRPVGESGEIDPGGSDLVLIDRNRSAYQLLRKVSAPALGDLMDSLPE